MCEKASILTLFIIFKVLILFIIPAFMIFLIVKRSENNKILKGIFIFEVVMISLFIILKIFNNGCIVNSTIGNIKNIDSVGNSNKIIYESVNTNNEILEPSIYFDGGNLRAIYYYNFATPPVSNYKFECDGNRYLKNYGSSLTTLATTISSLSKRNISVNELLNLALESNIFDCENGVDLDKLINVVSKNYSVKITPISVNDVKNTINSNKLVIADISYNKNSSNNLTCDNSSILIYSINEDGKYKIANPNQRTSLASYICPEGTDGEYDIIKSVAIDAVYTFDEISSIGTKYYSVERNGQ